MACARGDVMDLLPEVLSKLQGVPGPDSRGWFTVLRQNVKLRMGLYTLNSLTVQRCETSAD